MNKKLMVIQKGCVVFRAVYPRQCGETDGAWNLGLDVMIVLVSMPYPSKITEEVYHGQALFFGSSLAKDL